MRGLEPPASRATIWRSNQLSYNHHVRDAKLKQLHRIINACNFLPLPFPLLLSHYQGLETTRAGRKTIAQGLQQIILAVERLSTYLDTLLWTIFPFITKSLGSKECLGNFANCLEVMIYTKNLTS
jgi:hypothetical protein